jgi:hypothetical protein
MRCALLEMPGEHPVTSSRGCSLEASQSCWQSSSALFSRSNALQGAPCQAKAINLEAVQRGRIENTSITLKYCAANRAKAAISTIRPIHVPINHCSPMYAVSSTAP